MFEIFNRQKVRVLYFEQPSCIPSDDELTNMNRAGYKFKIDGKSISLTQFKSLRKER